MRLLDGNIANLSWDTSWDDYDLDALEGIVELVSGISFDLEDINGCTSKAKKRHTSLPVSMWLTSAATPGAPRISYKLREVTRGSLLRSKERGCPIPPPAPRTATFVRR